MQVAWIQSLAGTCLAWTAKQHIQYRLKHLRVTELGLACSPSTASSPVAWLAPNDSCRACLLHLPVTRAFGQPTVVVDHPGKVDSPKTLAGGKTMREYLYVGIRLNGLRR